jgi:7-carboxy-7-deazaguanine synthase
MSLMVSEIFRSVQGESTFAGIPCVFVRLAGCNLRCRYCDSTYAREDGEEMELTAILDQVSAYGIELVEITGGEPLFQSDTATLAGALCNMGHVVLIETNGSLDISVLPDGVIRIMDIKCPSSGETERVLWENIWKLKTDDEVKFVIADRHDYEWARGIIMERFAHTKTKVLLSTVYGELPPRHLVEWMLDDKLKARFQLQLHKYIWPRESRGR